MAFEVLLQPILLILAQVVVAEPQPHRQAGLLVIRGVGELVERGAETCREIPPHWMVLTDQFGAALDDFALDERAVGLDPPAYLRARLVDNGGNAACVEVPARREAGESAPDHGDSSRRRQAQLALVLKPV